MVFIKRHLAEFSLSQALLFMALEVTLCGSHAIYNVLEKDFEYRFIALASL